MVATHRREAGSGRSISSDCFHPRSAIWFPFAEESDLLVAVFGADKAKMGNVFYDSASRRADIEIEKWIRERSK